MGAAHFKLMYDEALRTDTRAVFWARARCVFALRCARAGKAAFWDIPMARIVDIARRLLAADDEYSAQLGELVGSGRITPFVMHGGRKHILRDPDIMVDPILDCKGREFSDFCEDMAMLCGFVRAGWPQVMPWQKQ
jgi:hypothetical protein